MNQDELKRAVARAAVDYVAANVPTGGSVGVVTNGRFARRGAGLLLLATPAGVKQMAG